MGMEGGQRVSGPDQRKLWIANLAEQTVDALVVDAADVPSLVELEPPLGESRKVRRVGLITCLQSYSTAFLSRWRSMGFLFF